MSPLSDFSSASSSLRWRSACDISSVSRGIQKKSSKLVGATLEVGWATLMSTEADAERQTQARRAKLEIMSPELSSSSGKVVRNKLSWFFGALLWADVLYSNRLRSYNLRPGVHVHQLERLKSCGKR
jgi:hypothetical protein